MKYLLLARAGQNQQASKLRCQPKISGHSFQALVSGPKFCLWGQLHCGQKMSVGVANASPKQRDLLNHRLNFVIGCNNGSGKVSQQRKNGKTIFQVAKSKLADDVRMHRYRVML